MTSSAALSELARTSVVVLLRRTLACSENTTTFTNESVALQAEGAKTTNKSIDQYRRRQRRRQHKADQREAGEEVDGSAREKRRRWTTARYKDIVVLSEMNGAAEGGWGGGGGRYFWCDITDSISSSSCYLCHL